MTSKRVYVGGGLSCGVNRNSGGGVGCRWLVLVGALVVLVGVGGESPRTVMFVARYLPLTSSYSMSYATASPGLAFASSGKRGNTFANTFAPSLSMMAAWKSLSGRWPGSGLMCRNRSFPHFNIVPVKDMVVALSKSKGDGMDVGFGNWWKA